MRTPTHIHEHTRVYTRAHAFSRSSLFFSHTDTHTHHATMQKHALTHTHVRVHMHTHTHTPNAKTHTLFLTHIDTHALSFSLFLSLTHVLSRTSTHTCSFEREMVG